MREGEGDAGQRERDVVEGRRLHRIFAHLLLAAVRGGLLNLGLVHVVSLWRGKFEFGLILERRPLNYDNFLVRYW